MKKSLLFFPLFITLLSCNRDPLQPMPTSNTQYLKQLEIQDSLVDYTHKLNLYYDGSYRVNKMTFDSKTFYPYPQRYQQFFTDSFYYNGTDTLPWKIETQIEISGQPSAHYTSFLSYNHLGQKVGDSAVFNDGTHTSIEKRVYIRGINYMVDRNYQDSILFENENMKKAYRKNYNRPFFDFFYDSVDNKINPYNKLNIAEGFFKRHLYISDDWVQNARQWIPGHFNMQALNSNNMVKWRLLNYAGGISPWTWYYTSQYTYSSDGYPVTQDLIIREGTETGPLYNRLRYNYTYY